MSERAALTGTLVAMLIEEEYEDREVTQPLETLRAAGVTVVVVGPVAGASYRGKRAEALVTADIAAGRAKINDFDAVVIPGGFAPDRMRMRHAMVDLARDAMEAG